VIYHRLSVNIARKLLSVGLSLMAYVWRYD